MAGVGPDVSLEQPADAVMIENHLRPEATVLIDGIPIPAAVSPKAALASKWDKSVMNRRRRSVLLQSQSSPAAPVGAVAQSTPRGTATLTPKFSFADMLKDGGGPLDSPRRQLLKAGSM